MITIRRPERTHTCLIRNLYICARDGHNHFPNLPEGALHILSYGPLKRRRQENSHLVRVLIWEREKEREKSAYTCVPAD
ncbi:hypothetical protein EVAR_83396_1 [Eumeta japonica]|uniref:Uncharacterized protein n=1 Tax=Eumeta variegata TaxID=151549 RepID=A0A4C1TYD1_EUMVA|nr:hypothetical protein EVAR_83396_1 [Eumeta japonica]